MVLDKLHFEDVDGRHMETRADLAAFETPLMRVGKVVRWEMFEPVAAAAVTGEPKGPGGRPRFDPLLMFKVLVLQRLHGLADDATSFQITDRNSFRAFLGLTPGDAVPDGQTISDFRAALTDILKAVVTPASVHDSQPLEALIDEGDRILWADSAYRSEDIEAALAARGLRSEIHEKGTRGHPLTEGQKAGNREKSRTRARVEHVFAQMSGSMKALYQRCIGMTRNAACLKLTNLVYNLLRFEQIKRLNLAAVA
jgi:IS5 family transposase